MTIVTAEFDLCNVITLGEEERGVCVPVVRFTCSEPRRRVQSGLSVVTGPAAAFLIFLNEVHFFTFYRVCACSS